jgi:hypothetical protein
MKQFVRLDVSQDVTHLCVLRGDGKISWQGKCRSTPEATVNSFWTAPRPLRPPSRVRSCQTGGRAKPAEEADRQLPSN